ncbi:MAG: hypothetical protein IV093_17105, partial [Rubrivivax sp.]|nr:hypothetical protein [Rubrivivax sp.]
STVNGALSVSSGGDVSQSDAIRAESVELLGEGAVNLLDARNNLPVVALGAGGGSVRLVNSSPLMIGSVGGTTGIDRNSDVALHAGGAITIDQGVNVAENQLRLQAMGGGVSQSANGAISAGTLGVVSTGGIVLGNPENTVGTVALRSNRSVLFAASSGYVIGSAIADPSAIANPQPGALVVFDGASGLRSNAATGVVELRTATGVVSQLQPIADASGLALRGGAEYALPAADNLVSTLAADAGAGTVHYVNAGPLNLANIATPDLPSGIALPTDSAITRTGGDVWVRALQGNLNLLANVSATTLGLQAQGDVTQSAGVITTTALGARSQTGSVLLPSANLLGSFSGQAAADVLLGEADGYVISTQAASPRTVVGGDASGSGVFAATTIGITAGAAQTIELNTASGKVSQTADLSAPAPNLVLRGNAAYELTRAGNVISLLAVGSGSGDVDIAVVGDLRIGTIGDVNGISRTGDVDVTASGLVSFEGNVQIAGNSIKTVTSTATPTIETDGTVRAQELAYVISRNGQTEAGVRLPDGNTTFDAFQIMGAVIGQSEGGSINLRDGTQLRLVSTQNGSITLDSPANSFDTGTVSARTGFSSTGISLVPELALRVPGTGEDYNLSRITLAGSVIRIGASGETVTVESYSHQRDRNFTVVGIEADLVRLRAPVIQTKGGTNDLAPYIIARYSAVPGKPTDNQIPGLVIGIPKINGAKSGFDIGASSESGPVDNSIGESRGLRIIVGHKPTQKRADGWVLVTPDPDLSNDPSGLGDKGFVDALNASPTTSIFFAGPTIRQGSYNVVIPNNGDPAAAATGGLRYVNSVYDGESPLTSAQAAALGSAADLQEKLRRDQLERSVSTENVARDLREAVIVEVGTGASATTGREGIKPPATCEPAPGKATSCGPAAK